VRRAFRFHIALLSFGLLALTASVGGWSQSRQPIVSSVHVEVPALPIPVTIAGKRHLVYELYITNVRSSEITLTRVEVSDAVRGGRLGAFQDAELDVRLARPVSAPDMTRRRAIPAGMRAVLYLWLALDDAAATPSKLQHTIELDVIRGSRSEHAIVDVGTADVRGDRPLVLQPPLRGGPWVALYDPMMAGGHRTSIYAVDGRARIPARFAIDWVRLERDASRARGDAAQIANWHGYGADVLAVADAVVVQAVDDMPESPTISGAAQTPIPLENVSGNFVCLAISGERYAFYEHLKHGSLSVKAGDRVRRGQVLASLGNSGGSSSGPHLHFHVADAKSELGGEGVPYVFESFDVVGAFETIGAFATGDAWGTTSAGGRRNREFPAANTVIMFPTRANK
jgi:murein DD-endopeptidase